MRRRAAQPPKFKDVPSRGVLLAWIDFLHQLLRESSDGLLLSLLARKSRKAGSRLLDHGRMGLVEIQYVVTNTKATNIWAKCQAMGQQVKANGITDLASERMLPNRSMALGMPTKTCEELPSNTAYFPKPFTDPCSKHTQVKYIALPNDALGNHEMPCNLRCSVACSEGQASFLYLDQEGKPNPVAEPTTTPLAS